MPYYIDDDALSLADLQELFRTTDLVPSHEPLLQDIDNKMAALKKADIKSVASLRARLKSKSALALVAKASGVDEGYLALLRRAVEGFFPKPRALKEFDWIDDDVISTLASAGVKNTLQLFDRCASNLTELTKATGLKRKDLAEIMALANLSRVQWLSPTFARVLLAAGFDDAAKIAAAKPDPLYEAVLVANQDARFYKGKVGRRDIARLVVAAGRVP